MRLFDAYLAIDWSASSSPTAKKPSPDAVWVGERVVGEDPRFSVSFEDYFRTRWECKDYLRRRLLSHINEGRRVFVGFDFAYGYPAGFAKARRLEEADPPWRIVWNELTRLIVDGENNENDRFEVAGNLNASCRGKALGPFWGCPVGWDIPDLAPKSPTFPFLTASGSTLEAKRETERQLKLKGVQPTWKLYGNGAVGSQSLLGIPAVAGLRDAPELQSISRVWPFETEFGLTPASAGMPFILHAEIWPGVVNDRLDPTLTIRDQAQVRAMVDWLSELDTANELLPLFGTPAGLSGERLRRVLDEEGWIFGSSS
jgi:hypothetical protein